MAIQYTPMSQKIIETPHNALYAFVFDGFEGNLIYFFINLDSSFSLLL